MSLRVPAETASAIRLSIQVVIATLMATIISLCAFGLALLVGVMKTHHAPDWMVTGTLALEIFLWAADVVCFTLFVANEVISFCVKPLEGAELEMNKPVQIPPPLGPTASTAVVIDARFVRDVARDAMVRFFVPLTAAFVRPSTEERRRRAG